VADFLGVEVLAGVAVLEGVVFFTEF